MNRPGRPDRIPTNSALVHHMRTKKIGITMDSLATRAGLSLHTVKRIESGFGADRASITRVAEVLGTTFNDLIDLDLASSAENRPRMKVALVLDQEFDTFDPEKVPGILERINDLITPKWRVSYIGIIPGSVLIVLDMDNDDVAKLMAAYMDGVLTEEGIVEVRLTNNIPATSHHEDIPGLENPPPDSSLTTIAHYAFRPFTFKTGQIALLRLFGSAVVVTEVVSFVARIQKLASPNFGGHDAAEKADMKTNGLIGTMKLNDRTTVEAYCWPTSHFESGRSICGLSPCDNMVYAVHATSNFRRGENEWRPLNENEFIIIPLGDTSCQFNLPHGASKKGIPEILVFSIRRSK